MLVLKATARLRFREVRYADAHDIFRTFEDPYARRFHPEMADPAEAVRCIERQLARYRQHGHGYWVVEHRRRGVFIGDCGLTFQPVEDGEILEVGYHVLAAERGKGYATEAATACRDHAFEVLGANLVGSIVHPDNHASRNVARRIHSQRRTFERDGQTLLLYFSERRS